MKMLRALLLAALAFILPAPGAVAQTIKATIPAPISIATGLTYQQIVASGAKFSLLIQNNSTISSENCFIIIGGPFLAGDTTATTRTVAGVSLTAAKASILLQPGQSYARYTPYIPGDTILGTCATAGDSIYVETQ